MGTTEVSSCQCPFPSKQAQVTGYVPKPFYVIWNGPKFFTPYLYGDSSVFGDVYSFLNKHAYQEFYKRTLALDFVGDFVCRLSKFYLNGVRFVSLNIS